MRGGGDGVREECRGGERDEERVGEECMWRVERVRGRRGRMCGWKERECQEICDSWEGEKEEERKRQEKQAGGRE